MNPAEITETWNKEVIFSDGDDFFEAVIDSVFSAEKSIFIEMYIFDLDELGKRILAALSIAADRGVIVKLLLDGAGCSEWKFEDARQYRKSNFEIKFFHPLYWQKRYSRLWSYVNVSKIIRGISLMNHRNHRKVFLIDDDIAFMGSMNVSARHLKSLAHENVWRDTGVMISGKQVKVLHEAFIDVWNYFTNYVLRYRHWRKPTSGLPLLSLNRTSRQRRDTYGNLLYRLRSAKRRIWITNPYFLPTYRLRRLLQNASRRGIEVLLLFPSKSDFFGVKYAMESHYTPLLRAGIKIFEYQPAMIHAKVLITDDRVLVGSSNLNSRSLLHDLEVDVEITHEDNIQTLETQFLLDLQQSKKIELAEWRKRSLLQKVLEKLFFLFRLVL